MKKAVYFIWQCLWGAPQSLLGLLVFLRWRNRPHFWYHGALVTVWGARGGMSLGLFVFIPAAENQTARPDAPAPGSKERYLHTLHHEYGHTLQSLLLGPLYLIVIGLPSLIWAWQYKGDNKGYYKFFTERWADRLGEVKR